MNKEEEIIKKYLHDIATEDYSEVWHEFPVKIPNKPELSHEISDWTSNHRRSLSMQLPSMSKNNKSFAIKTNKKTTACRSYLFQNPEKKSGGKDVANPVTIKFSRKNLRDQNKNLLLLDSFLQKESGKNMKGSDHFRHLLDKISQNKKPRYRKPLSDIHTERGSNILSILQKRERYRPLLKKV